MQKMSQQIKNTIFGILERGRRVCICDWVFEGQREVLFTTLCVQLAGPLVSWASIWTIHVAEGVLWLQICATMPGFSWV